MGKKKSTLKNIMVTLGCTACAGVVFIGGSCAAGSYLGLENSLVDTAKKSVARPAWLDKVEIRVNEQGASASLAGESQAGGTAGSSQYNGSIIGGGKNSKEEDIPKKPGRKKEKETEAMTEDESETRQEPEDENEIQTETETETDKDGTKAETQTDEGVEGRDQDDKADKDGKTDRTEKKDSSKKQIEVAQAQVIKQEEITGAVIMDVTEVVKEAMPCVVSITNEFTAYDYWYDREYDEKANGSGIIVAQNDEELLIVTNYHVVEDNNNLYVQFTDDAEAMAYVKGKSPENDLAVVSVFLEDMSDDTLESIAIAALGDSDSLQVGEPAIAIGDSLGYGQSVTTGIISALNRDIFEEDAEIKQGYLIQTDAAINPGNSGGALLNVKGEVIGINSSKIADYVIEGMGYAIPISAAKPIIEDLMTKETRKKVSGDKRAFLGISGTDVTEDAIERYDMPEGAFVTGVVEDTAADEAGILKGDIITYIDDDEITGMDQLQAVLEYYAAGTEVEIVVMRQRDGEYKKHTIDVTLGAKEE